MTDKKNTKIHALDDIPATVAPDEAVVREVASPAFAGITRHSVAYIEVPAGVRIARHYHRELEEVYHLIEGRGVMHLGDETRQVGPGDTILIEPGTWHDIEAEEGGRIVMLVTCAPAWHPGDQFFK